MKKTLFILLAIVLLVQTSCIVKDKYKETDIFSDYEQEQGFGVFHIPPVLFKFVFSLSDENQADVDVLNKIDVIKVLFFEESEKTMHLAELNSSIKEKVNEFNYNLLTKIAQETTDISIYVIDQDDVIREVLITIISDNDYIGLNLIGELTKDDVMQVYKAVNLDNVRNYNN